MWIFILVFIVGLSEGQEFHISQATATAKNATRLCELATPPVTFSTTEPTIDIGSTDINQDLWVGYAGTDTAFVYRGCSPEPTGSPKQLTADLGMCFSHCLSKQDSAHFVGIVREIPGRNEASCFCLQNIVANVHEDCGNICASPIMALCGGKHGGNSYISVYEKVTMPETNSSPLTNTREASCLAYEPSEKYMFWTDCTKYLRRLCQDENGSLRPGDGNNNEWSNSMRECLNANTYPVGPFGNYTSIPGEVGQYWIGAIKGFSIVPVSDVMSNEKHIHQGYIGENKHLKLDERHDHLRAVCVKGSIVASTTPRSEGSTHSSTSSVSRSSSSTVSVVGSTVRQSSPSTTSLVPDGTTNSSLPTFSGASHPPSSTPSDGNALKRANGGSDSLIAMYVILPVVIIAIVAGVGIFCWRRRNKKPEKHSMEIDNIKTLPHISDPKSMTTVNNGYLEKSEEATVRHDYMVLEPVDEYAVIKDTDVNDDGDDDYDTTTAIDRKGADNDTGNIYNRLASETEDTYDHANMAGNTEDSTYDHAGGVGTESTYNTTEALSQSKKGPSSPTGDYDITNPVDDTYNHLGGPVGGTAAEDTYNRAGSDMRNPAQVAQDYTYTNPLPQKPVQTQDKTKTNYDYTYAKAGTNGSTMPVKFTFDQSPSSAGYEFAKEPSATANYELAKPPVE